MKYIFEYIAGTKGDMTVRFLNGVEPNISFDRANKSEPQELECENWLKLVNPNDLTLERFEEVLSVNTNQYLPAHPLWVCERNERYMDLLKEYDYGIVSLKYEPKHYVTIYIERVLKNEYNFNEKGEFSNSNYVTAILNENSRGRLRAKDLDMGPSKLFALVESSWWGKRWRELTNNRTLLHYDDLFLTDSCPFPEHAHREDEWLMLVEQSWCDYDKNGYRKYEVPEDWEQYSHLFHRGRPV